MANSSTKKTAQENQYFSPEHQRQAYSALHSLDWPALTADTDAESGLGRAFHCTVVDLTNDHTKFRHSLLSALDSKYNGTASIFCKSECKHAATDETPSQWNHVHLVLILPGHYSATNVQIDLLKWVALFTERNTSYFNPGILGKLVAVSGVYTLQGQNSPSELIDYVCKPTPKVDTLNYRHYRTVRWYLHASSLGD